MDEESSSQRGMARDVPHIACQSDPVQKVNSTVLERHSLSFLRGFSCERWEAIRAEGEQVCRGWWSWEGYEINTHIFLDQLSKDPLLPHLIWLNPLRNFSGWEFSSTLFYLTAYLPSVSSFVEIYLNLLSILLFQLLHSISSSLLFLFSFRIYFLLFYFIILIWFQKEE